MPISRSDALPFIGNIIWNTNPSRILDVGIGFGHMGVLFRAWTDIRMAELDPDRYHHLGWKTEIHGIEIHPPYANPLYEFIYDVVYWGDALEEIKKLGSYDVIYLGDIIEHYEKEMGEILLRNAAQHLTPKGFLVVATPEGFRPQGPVLNNPNEEHKSGWTKADFDRFGAVSSVTLAGQTVAVFRKGGPNAT